MRVNIKAYREPGGVSELALDATDISAACREVESQGYRVISAEASGQWLQSITQFRGRRFNVSLFCQELLALLDAGMGLVESIAILASKAKQPEARRILSELHRLLGEGRTFSRALEADSSAFPSLFVATMRASERTGNLPEALRRYLAYQRQLNAIKDKVVAASVYPMLLIVVGMLVVVFLLAYVVPRFSRVYEDVGEAHLPLMSRLLMHWGQAVGAHAWMLGMFFFALLAGVVYAFTRPEIRAAIERRLWRLPVIGDASRYQIGVQFAGNTNRQVDALFDQVDAAVDHQHVHRYLRIQLLVVHYCGRQMRHAERHAGGHPQLAFGVANILPRGIFHFAA
jgi:general secretion pathway protein F